MTSRDFAFWLQGSFEVCEDKSLTENQVNIIKAHLALVFRHEIDPSMGGKDHQKTLNDIHNQSNQSGAGHSSLPIQYTNLDPDGEKMRC